MTGAVLALAGAVPGGDNQTIRYYGVYCGTGKSSRGLPSVVCVRHDHVGYTVLISKQWIALRYGLGPISWRPNR